MTGERGVILVDKISVGVALTALTLLLERE